VRSGEGAVPLRRKFLYFLYQNGEFYAFQVILIDTVTANRYERKPENGTVIKRAGVRTPWTPPGSAPVV